MPLYPDLIGAYAPYIDPDALTVGESTIPRRMTLSTPTLTSGSIRLAYFTARKTESVTQIRGISGSTNSSGLTLGKMGLYTVAGNGDLTLVAATANVTTLFNVASTRTDVALTGTYAKVAEQRYAYAVLCIGSTMPTIMGLVSLNIPAEMALAPRLAAVLSGQTDLPGSIVAGTLTDSSTIPYGALLP